MYTVDCSGGGVYTVDCSDGGVYTVDCSGGGVYTVDCSGGGVYTVDCSGVTANICRSPDSVGGDSICSGVCGSEGTADGGRTHPRRCTA